MDTIFALSTGSSRAAIAVVRVSGPEAITAFHALTGSEKFTPRLAGIHALKEPESGKVIDFQSLVTVFPAPTSYTGEDVVEYSIHGGRAVIDGLLQTLGAMPGFRMADPGEFTKRAFTNGKMDLTEAEAIADLIDAETEAQRLQSISQAQGSLMRLYHGWADRLTKTLAHQEADIEFPEDDMPAGIAETLAPEVRGLLDEIRGHLDDNRRGERLRDGIRIAVIGAPNAGKSSLVNALARRDVAIVSDEAGTTRDVIEVHLDLGGYPVILSDTAGLRVSDNKVETEGIRRAESTAREAEITLALFDGTAKEQDKDTQKLVTENTITVFTKSDMGQRGEGLHISSKTGEGIDALLKALTQKAADLLQSRPGPALTRERHRAALLSTAEALERSLDASQPELAAEDLRLALRALGGITGRVHVEELLDRIFRDFCIGK